MENPKNQNAEVLYCLIKNEYITRSDIFLNTRILNLTAHIANLRLRYGIVIKCTKVERINKHGRRIKYGKWSIEDKTNIQDIYKIVNK